MKKIAIVTNTRKAHLGQFLKDNFKMVFADAVKINNYYLDELEPDDKIKDDIVLVMIKSKALEIKKYVSEAQRMIVVSRTIQASEAYKIFSIPPHAKVLVVNDTPETTLEMVALLYQLEFNHLHFVHEIGDMPYMLQAKLFRVLQERQIMRIGSRSMINVNIRIITATHHNLQDKIKYIPLSLARQYSRTQQCSTLYLLYDEGRSHLRDAPL